MNPARTFGPALAMGNFSYLWMYVAGPLLGGGLAALVYNSIFLDRR
jgi:aquaporin TIP